MEFDFAGLKKISHPTYPGRYPIFGVVNSGDGLREASWKTEERQRLFEESPEGQMQLQRLAQEQQQTEMNELHMQAAREKQKELEKEAYNKWQKEQILKSVADTKFEDMLRSGSIDSSILLEKQAKDAAAEALRRGRQDLAQDFLERANKYGTDADTSRKKDAAIQQERMNSVLSDLVASPPKNAVDWSYTKQRMAENGIIVPDQYQSWSEGTSKWLQEKGMQVKAVRDSAVTQARIEKMEADEKARFAKIEADKEKQANKDRIAALNREGVEVGKPVSGRMLEDTIDELSVNDNFKDLEYEVQTKAAREINPLAKRFLKEGTARDALEARDMAIKEVLRGIKEGNYIPYSERESAGGSAPKAALDYLKAHPEQKEMFKKKYGYLPEGY